MFWETLNGFTFTENGALTRNTSKSYVLDMFAMGGSMRTRSDKEIVEMFSKAFYENPALALKCLFYIRDCRGGLGEKNFFRVSSRWLLDKFSKISKENFINLTAEYGSWKDVFSILTENEYIPTVSYLFKNDFINKKPTLMEKYMPSVGGSRNNAANKIAKHMNITPREYRKILSFLRNELGIVESKMCSKEWDKISYEAVPSKAMLNYSDSFKRNDTDRFTKYIDKVNSDEAKINSSVLYPYEIWRKLKSNPQSNAEATALWNNLPDFTNGKNAIVMADVSGSMACGDGLPIAVSVSLALYFAERNKGKFHGSFMTFSGKPSIEKVRGETLLEKMNNISRANWEMNTDIIRAFETILSVCLKEKVPQTEMPETIYIISDMEFDVATKTSWVGEENLLITNYDAIKERYAISGYKIPKIVFWNVNSHQNNIPVAKDELNTVLVSGSSPSVFKFAVSDNCSPEKFMLDILNNKRYEQVEILYI